MVAPMMAIPAMPVEAVLALTLAMVVGVLLALHEAGWLGLLRDRRVLAVAMALLVAGLLTQTVSASTIYDLRFYCESWLGWFDVLCW